MPPVVRTTFLPILVLLRLFCRVVGKHASNQGRDLIALTFEANSHVGDVITASVSLKIVGLPVLKI